jgi:hypothetical protein
MGAQSFIYRHVAIYRFIMNILYGGRYKERFCKVIEQIKDLPSNSQILELCFGDTYIAEYCTRNGHRWKGIDLNKYFVRKAQNLGYDALDADLVTCQKLPKANVCIMVGSLYHFYPNTFSILSKMADAADTIIISEPVSNLSSRKDIIGFFAKRAASVGKGHETFRYDPASFTSIISECSALLNYRIDSTHSYGKDLIIKIIKNGSN